LRQFGDCAESGPMRGRSNEKTKGMDSAALGHLQGNGCPMVWTQLFQEAAANFLVELVDVESNDQQDTEIGAQKEGSHTGMADLYGVRYTRQWNGFQSPGIRTEKGTETETQETSNMNSDDTSEDERLDIKLYT